MARQKKGRPVSGWIILDKPLGMGSTQAVAKVKWLFGAQKAGHAGTLDPLATGMLPIALGEATKTVPYVMDGTKVYRFEVTWGARTSTDDLEGEVIAKSEARPGREAIEAILPEFTGTIRQVPPQFSAIKVDGERAYDVARSGEEVDLAAREVEIDRLEITEYHADRTLFEVECGKGTYVRSLARDMGEALGCHGHVSLLRRIVVDPFQEADLVTLETLAGKSPRQDGVKLTGDEPEDDFAALDALLLETGDAMGAFPRVDLNDEQANRIRLGNPAIIRGRDAPLSEEVVCVFLRGSLLAIGEISHGEFRPKRLIKR